MTYVWRTTKSDDALNAVLDKVAEWQERGRSGYCLPVLDGALLEGLEAMTNERRRDLCTVCGGSGEIEDYENHWPCRHCEPIT